MFLGLAGWTLLIVILPILLVVLLIVAIARLARGPQRDSTISAEDERLMRELWTRLDRFEKRMANLETILVDEHRRV